MHPKTQNPKPISLWLFTCCALVFLMVMVGAITRLTESGLSIAEWKPLMGVLPPLNEAEWMRVFDLYKQTPQFQKTNPWMELGDFKTIFFWEWFHRFLGRMIGLAYALPLLFFWIRKQIPQGWTFKLLFPLILGGAQGFMGWYMVKSGLVDIPAVSHYRLAAHLLLALLIYGVMLWLGLSLEQKNKTKPEKNLFLHAVLTLIFLITTITWGAFTAGLDGGLIYNDNFPKMGTTWIPPEANESILSTPAGAQFLHRWLAMATVIMIFGFWLHATIKRRASPALHALAIMSVIQMGLGIATLFSGVFLPLAVAHQAGALIILTLLLIYAHGIKPRDY
ncbi:MAG: COX15/CtaA family protein [Alphaproteobacteria bacterium]